MTARGPAWEGDPAAARLGYDPQTAPLPYGVTSGDPYRETAPYLDQDPDGYGPAGYGPAGYGQDSDGWGQPRWRRRGRGRRLLRWLVAALIGLVAAGRRRVRPALRDDPCGGQRPRAGPGHRPRAPCPLPGPAGPGAVRRVAGRHRGPPVLLRARHRRVRGGPGGRGHRHRARRRAGWRHALSAAGQDALHARRQRPAHRGGAGDARHQARPDVQQGADPADVRRRGLLRARLLRPGRGQLRLLRHRPAGLTLPEAATLAGLVQGPSADDPIAHYARGRAREAHVLDRLVATGKITAAQSAAAYTRGLHLVGGTGRGCLRNTAGQLTGADRSASAAR